MLLMLSSVKQQDGKESAPEDFIQPPYDDETLPFEQTLRK